MKRREEILAFFCAKSYLYNRGKIIRKQKMFHDKAYVVINCFGVHLKKINKRY